MQTTPSISGRTTTWPPPTITGGSWFAITEAPFGSWADTWDGFADHLDEALSAGMHEALGPVLDALSAAMENDPEWGEHMGDAVTVWTEDGDLYVGFTDENADRAQRLEEGDHNNPPNPILGPVLRSNQDDIGEALTRALLEHGGLV